MIRPPIRPSSKPPMRGMTPPGPPRPPLDSTFFVLWIVILSGVAAFWSLVWRLLK